MADLCNADDPVALARSKGERIGSLQEVIPNLLAPIVVNRHTREAVQVVLTDDHDLRAPLLGG